MFVKTKENRENRKGTKETNTEKDPQKKLEKSFSRSNRRWKFNEHGEKRDVGNKLVSSTLK